jgi:hypothetical protein
MDLITLLLGAIIGIPFTIVWGALNRASAEVFGEHTNTHKFTLASQRDCAV